MNSGRPIGVVQEGSSNSGHEQGSSMNSGRPIGVVHEQCSSKLITHDLQLRKVISPSFELRFGCSWTSWKAH